MEHKTETISDTSIPESLIFETPKKESDSDVLNVKILQSRALVELEATITDTRDKLLNLLERVKHLETLLLSLKSVIQVN